MASRFLRPICEQCLYKTVMLSGMPKRTICLLETFTRRPDLALLVRHLAIDFSWFSWPEMWETKIPEKVKSDDFEALSLARNVVSLELGGINNWMKEPESAWLRDVISSMPLTRLSLPKILDPGTIPEYFESRSILRHEGWDRDIAGEIRAVLQAQSQLESLFFTWLRYSDQLLSALLATLIPSDIANLKGLEAEPRSAIPFIGIAPNLESLSLLPTVWTGWSDELFSKLKSSSAESQSTLRRLAIHVSYDDQWIWANLDKVLALFPNTEALRLVVRTDMQPEDFLEKVRAAFRSSDR